MRRGGPVMKSIITAAGVLAIALIAANASAHDGDSGWRVGGSAIISQLKRDDNLVDDSGFGVKLHGQYRFNSWFGIEGGYFNSGEASSNASSASGSDVELVYKGIAFQGIGYIPSPMEEVDLYLKAGFYDFDVDLTIDGVDGGEGSDSGAVLGAGGSVHLTEQLHFRTEFDWYDVSGAELWTVSVGVEYHF